jgi:hypothetical protein
LVLLESLVKVVNCKVLAEVTFGSKMFDGNKDFSGSRRHLSVRKEYELGIKNKISAISAKRDLCYLTHS